MILFLSCWCLCTARSEIKTERMTYMNNHEYQIKKRQRTQSKRKYKESNCVLTVIHSAWCIFLEDYKVLASILHSFHTVSKSIKEECYIPTIRRSAFRKLWCTYSECFFTFCSSTEDSYPISNLLLWSEKQINFFHLFES